MKEPFYNWYKSSPKLENTEDFCRFTNEVYCTILENTSVCLCVSPQNFSSEVIACAIISNEIFNLFEALIIDTGVDSKALGELQAFLDERNISNRIISVETTPDMTREEVHWKIKKAVAEQDFSYDYEVIVCSKEYESERASSALLKLHSDTLLTNSKRLPLLAGLSSKDIAHLANILTEPDFLFTHRNNGILDALRIENESLRKEIEDLKRFKNIIDARTHQQEEQP